MHRYFRSCTKKTIFFLSFFLKFERMVRPFVQLHGVGLFKSTQVCTSSSAIIENVQHKKDFNAFSHAPSISLFIFTYGMGWACGKRKKFETIYHSTLYCTMYVYASGMKMVQRSTEILILRTVKMKMGKWQLSFIVAIKWKTLYYNRFDTSYDDVLCTMTMKWSLLDLSVRLTDREKKMHEKLKISQTEREKRRKKNKPITNCNLQ